MSLGWKAMLIASGLIVSSCSNRPTVIDGSSPEAFEKSIEKARRDLPRGRDAYGHFSASPAPFSRALPARRRQGRSAGRWVTA